MNEDSKRSTSEKYFSIRINKSKKIKKKKNLGFTTIKYGETIVFIRHVDSDLWISYETLELTIKGIGKVEEKRVKPFSYVLHAIGCLSVLIRSFQQSKVIWMIVFDLYALKNKNKKLH